MKKTTWLLSLFLVSYLGYSQIIWTAGGTGTAGSSGDNGLAISALINSPKGIVTDASGNIYFADASNNKIRKISTTGVVTTIAGTGTAGFSGDGGAATSAKLDNPNGIAFDASGNLYIADPGNARVRKINTSGTISTFAGTGTIGNNGDGGQATSANLNSPADVAVWSGNLYICDYGAQVIRKVVISTGIISTVAGNGTWGYSGDGGVATSAQLYNPWGVDVNSSGDIFIADATNDRVRKVAASNGYISTIAGTGTAGYTGDGGIGTSAQIDNPISMAVDPNSGDVYFCSNYKAVRKVAASNGYISTVIGNGTQGFSGDGGSPTSASIGSDYGIYVDASGNLYLADTQNNRIRKVSSTCPANAGPNKTNLEDCCTNNSYPGVQIGALNVPNVTYAWSPSTNLTSTSAAQPTSNYTSSTVLTYTVTVSYSLCTTSNSTVQVHGQEYTGESCCRIGNISSNPIHDFAVYPNPATNQALITLYDVAEYLQITDIHGKIVFEIKNVADSELLIDVTKFSKGIYFITAKIGETIEKSKLIKE